MSEDFVVVGVDGSPASQAALQWAVHVADTYGASVAAVRAWESGVVSTFTASQSPDEMPREVLDAVDRQIQQALQHRSPGTVPVRAHAPEGDPADALLSSAAEGRLLALGRNGEGSLRRHVLGTQLGSIANRCLTQATFPVAVVPPDAAVAAPARVLVGVDGSAASARALRWGVEHARSVRAPVVAVMAWQLTTVPPPESTRESGPSLHCRSGRPRPGPCSTRRSTRRSPSSRCRGSTASSCAARRQQGCSTPRARTTCSSSASGAVVDSRDCCWAR